MGYLGNTSLSRLWEKVKAYADAKMGAVTPYGVCSTAAATAAKTVTVDSDSFALETGVSVRVKFTYSNTVASPTLNVNGTGAKAIKRYGTTAVSTSAASSWNAGSILELTYDGTNWIINNFLNTTYSSMTVAEYEAGTGTSARLITPARLKAAILQWAAEKAHTHDYLPLSGGSLTGQVLFDTGTTQSATKGLKWSAINSKNPYIGYALNQVDGTFLICSLLGTNYQDGLAIGGGSGNLLWKGTKVATTSDITDTKNTAGSTNSSSKLFLVGATSQAANPQTYSHDTVYIGTDGCLYSGSKIVATQEYVNNAVSNAGGSSGSSDTKSAIMVGAASGQTLANTSKNLTMDSVLFNTGDKFSLSEGSVLVNSPCTVEITGSLYISSGLSSGDYVTIKIIKNSTNSGAMACRGVASATRLGITLAPVIMNVDAGDYIHFNVVNSSSRGAVNSGASSSNGYTRLVVKEL